MQLHVTCQHQVVFAVTAATVGRIQQACHRFSQTKREYENATKKNSMRISPTSTATHTPAVIYHTAVQLQHAGDLKHLSFGLCLYNCTAQTQDTMRHTQKIVVKACIPARAWLELFAPLLLFAVRAVLRFCE